MRPDVLRKVFWLWVAVYVMLMAAFGYHLLMRPLGEWATFIPFALEFSVAAVFILAARRSDRINADAARPWSWMGLAIIIFSTVEIMGLSGMANYSDPLAIVGYTTFYLAFFKGLRSFERPSLSRPQLIRVFLDSAIIGAACLAILHEILVQASPEKELQNFWVLAYSILDMLLLWALLALLFDPKHLKRGSLARLAFAVVILIFSDIAYALQAILNLDFLYAINTFGFNLSFFLMGLAAWRSDEVVSKETPDPQVRYRPASQLFAFGLFWAAILVLITPSLSPSTHTVVYFLVLVGLATTRLRFNQLDMIRTLGQLEESNVLLETRVAERTKELENLNEKLREEIAERIRVQESLLHSENRFRSLTELTAEGVLVIQEGLVVDANSSVSDLSGYSLAQLKGRQPGILLAAHVRDRMAGELDRGWDGVKELEGQKLDGSTIMMEWRCQRTMWNSRPAQVILIRDVSDLRAAELQRSIAAERIRTQESTMLQILTILEHGPFEHAIRAITELVASCLHVERVSVWLLDDDSLTLRCETEFLRVSQSHQTGLTLLAHDYPRYFQAMRSQLVIDAEDATTDPRTSEFAAGYLDVNRIFSMLDTPIRVQGVVRGVFCCEHVGDRRKWHADEVVFCGQVADQLAQVLLKRQEKLLQDRLSQMERMETVGNLAGGIAHDFNNLLTPIMGYADIIHNELPKDSPWRKDLLAIQAAAERAKNLARQLLMFSRKSVAEMKIYDLRTIVREFLRILRRTVREDIAIEYNQSDESLPILGDVSQMEQILMNLAVNAQDAMPTGGRITIRLQKMVSDQQQTKTFPSLPAGDVVVLDFADSGRGMEPQVLKHIFEPFFTTKEVGKGTGLGLATVYGIVRQHRGHIEVESEAGKGTRFQIFLPLAKPGEEARAAEAEPLPPMGGTETICIVEDNDMVRQLAEVALSQKGYKTLSFANPHACLHAISTEGLSFNLLLSDVIMPGMSGKQLYEILRERFHGLRVIYMSGYSDNVISAHDLLDGEAHFIQKPFSVSTLTARVREVLDPPSKES